MNTVNSEDNKVQINCKIRYETRPRAEEAKVTQNTLCHFGREKFTLWSYAEESQVGDPQRLPNTGKGGEPGEAVLEADTHFKAYL